MKSNLLICLFLISISSCEEKKTNPHQNLHDIWAATQINDQTVDKSQPIPRLEINLMEKRIMGNDGCNEYFGPIKEMSNTILSFGDLASTKKACRNPIAQVYMQALAEVNSYKIEHLNLSLYNAKGDNILSFKKVD